MPHQCVKCSAMYGDGANEILHGCSECGHETFFYIQEDQVEEAKETVQELSEAEKEQIEEDARELIGDDKEDDLPVVLDFESVNIDKPGKYQLDLVNLFQDESPLVYRLHDGKYVIDLPETMQREG